MSRQKIAYFDCIGGASGDMILGAMLDAGLPEETLRDRLGALGLDHFELRCRRVSKNGFGAIKVDVVVDDDAPARHLREIEAIVESSDLPDGIKAEAIGIFRRIGEVEGRIHGMSLERVHLHELGGIDTIVDVVGALIGIEELGVDRIVASPLPLGHGFTSGAHGQIPLPAPATLALLEGVPVRGTDIDAELVTPTGAALLSTLASEFGPIPPMSTTAIGYGAGERDLPIPNVLRLILGEEAAPSSSSTEPMVVIETNLDDLNPEIYDHVMARLFDAGALDVYLSPLLMKKSRPATLLRALCRPSDADSLTEILFAETSTLGVRHMPVTRRSLARSIETVETPFGPVRVKVARFGGVGAEPSHGGTKSSPEYEDCRRLAEQHGVPLRDVYRAAERAADKAAAERAGDE